MVSRSTYTDLLKAMNGHNTLNGWDVLVSYDVKMVNELLADRAAKNPNTMNMDPFWASFKPFGRPKEYYYFSLQFANPELQFKDKTGNVSLKMMMTGKFSAPQEKDDKIPELAYDVPFGLFTTLETELSNVFGTWNVDGEFVPAENPDDKPMNYVTEMSDGTARNACINFSKITSAKITAVENSENEEDMEFLNSMLPQLIMKHFQSQKNGFQFYISGVNATTASSTSTSSLGASILSPKSFVFTIVPGKGDESGTLCTWIGVAGGRDGGKHPSGETSVTFHPDTEDMSPIPKGNTASVIFSFELMSTQFFGSAFTAAGFTDIICKPSLGKSGMSFDARLANHPVHVDEYKHTYGPDHRISINSMDFNAAEKVCSIEISGNLATETESSCVLKYESNGHGIGWNEWKTTAGMYGPTEKHIYGTVVTIFKLTGKGAWRGSTDQNHPNQLGMTVTFPPVFELTTESQSVDFWDKFLGGRDKIPDQFKNIQARVHDVTLNLNPMDYFLTTNLLFPGEHVFVADNPISKSGEAGQSHGLAMPRDTILTGNIVGVPKVKRRVIEEIAASKQCL